MKEILYRLKYDVKRIEEVVYDVSLRKLNVNASTSAEEKPKENGGT